MHCFRDRSHDAREYCWVLAVFQRAFDVVQNLLPEGVLCRRSVIHRGDRITSHADSTTMITRRWGTTQAVNAEPGIR